MSSCDLAWNFLCELADAAGTSDITLASDGRVAVRRRGQLSVSQSPWLAEAWAEVRQTLLGISIQSQRSTRVCTAPGGRRYRATWSAHSRGESLSLRPLALVVPTADELLLPATLLDYFVSLRGGLVLVAGPTGSGKTTTVAALLRARAGSVGGKYITLEDPVEHVHSDHETAFFEQRELGRDLVSYAAGVREALHMNPDVIAVQELRETAAAETALSAALSGHLVVASMHAFSASTTPQRFLALINPGMEDLGARDALASCLEAVVVQRLVPGYERMVPVFEIMLLRDGTGRSAAMERLLRQGNWPGLRQEIEVGGRIGMVAWDEALRRRREEGLIP